MKELKSGDRVAVYRDGQRKVRRVCMILSDDRIGLEGDIESNAVHRKQCRLLVPKKRRKWVLGLSIAKEVPIVLSGDIIFPGEVISVIEVVKKNEPST